MQGTGVQILSLHDKKNGVLTFDLKDVLRVLGDHLSQWTWCITHLECVSGASDALCRQVEAAQGSALWQTSEDLLRQAEDISQTIEGKFIAFPRGVDRQTLTAGDLDLWSFQDSKAVLAIVAVD